jgi:hypothetical protein
MESGDRPTQHNGGVVAALEAVRALESSLDTLAAKVDDLARRLGAAEERFEKIVASIGEQD